MTTSEAGASDILKGVQFLLSKWECNEIPADVVLALIEVHLEREKELAPVPTKGQDLNSRTNRGI